MTEVKFYDNTDDNLLKFAVIISKANGKFVLCKHKERNTYEIPGGHREKGETVLEAAKRELKEETGAVDFTIKPVCVYSVKGKTRVNENVDNETFGMLYVADIFSFEEIHSEIEKIIITDKLEYDWTYPLIQPKLMKEAQPRGLFINKKEGVSALNSSCKQSPKHAKTQTEFSFADCAPNLHNFTFLYFLLTE